MRWQCGAEQPAPCALQGVCRCEGMSAVVDVRVHVGISPLCSPCSFFQQRGPVPLGVPLHHGLLHLVRSLELPWLFSRSRRISGPKHSANPQRGVGCRAWPLQLLYIHPQSCRQRVVPAPLADPLRSPATNQAPAAPCQGVFSAPCAACATRAPSPPSRGLPARFTPSRAVNHSAPSAPSLPLKVFINCDRLPCACFSRRCKFSALVDSAPLLLVRILAAGGAWLCRS